MKTGLVLAIVFLLGGLLGSQYGANQLQLLGSESNTNSSTAKEEMKPLYWVAPMDKNYRRDSPGLSPMGMELVPVYEDVSTGEEGYVTISAAVENNLGVKTAKVDRSTLYNTIDTVGVVEFDESKIHHIHSRVEGWIDLLNVSSVGDKVTKGQTLYELYSPALVNAQEEFLAALRGGNSNLIKASKSRLYSLGLNESQVSLLQKRKKVDQRIKVISNMNGVVTHLMVRHGMFIRPDTELLSISSLDTVWVIGDVFERQAGLVQKGQSVELWFNAYPETSWTGMVDYIYPELDPSTRTLSIRIAIDNPNHILKPNMFANVRISSDESESSLNIPRQALIKTKHHQRVVKSLGNGKYQSVFVKTGKEGLKTGVNNTGVSFIQITEGLSEGDEVVTSAQFLIDSESNISAELERMNGSVSMLGDQTEKEDESSTSVMGMGKINDVMSGHSMLNITHEPILEWGWPEMTMNFDVATTIDLDQFQENEEVCFTVSKLKDGSIVITEIFSMEDDASALGGSK